MLINSKPEAKFEIIRETLSQADNLLNISWLCSIAGVSRSGYYSWQAAEATRSMRDEKDKRDFELILDAYHFRGYAKGARGIYMRLLHCNPPTVMNIKKIRRLMGKYGLRCSIRKANPYRRMIRSLQSSNVAPNLLNREFKDHGARSVLLTDITYIKRMDGKFSYLSMIVDAYTNQILSHVVSNSLEADFVLQTVNQLLTTHGTSLHSDSLIHSDQGGQYRSYKYAELLKNSELRQSMSRKANCWDNAPQESLFGHMKDEIDLRHCSSNDHVKLIIDDWIDYYNNERYQWGLARLSPNEYYEYLITGVYPLPNKLL